MESYQILFPDPGRPRKPNINSHPRLSDSARKLLKFYDEMSKNDRKLLVAVASKLAKA
ncbi:MAG: hypothetical protein ACRD3T_22160 [Terriglobia bacterium]